jgi:hypothetical protein
MIGRTIRTAALAVAVLGGVAAAHGAGAQSLGPDTGGRPGLSCCPDRASLSISHAVQIAQIDRIRETDGFARMSVGLPIGNSRDRRMGMKFP